MKSEKLFTDNNWNRKQNDAFKCFADSLFFRRPTEGIVTPLVFAGNSACIKYLLF